MNLTDKRFHDSRKARKWLEEQRWPNGVQCTHCQSFSITPLTGKKHREGLYQCNDCRKQFTVTTGSVMERSRLPLNKWVAAMYMMASSKKGVSAHQLHRTLGITYQSAWFLAHRIREAMRDDAPSMIGGGGEIVEADETYHGKPETPHVSPHRKGRPYKYAAKGPRNSRPIVSLVERGGRVRTFHVAVADKANVTEIVRSNVARETRLHTDESRLYHGSEEHFESHETVRHSAKEYARGDVHTNSVEGYFSIFKRGMRGVYQHCKEKHLHRYLAEFDFRYNNRVALGVNDNARANQIVRQIGGKRLTYRRTNEAGV